MANPTYKGTPLMVLKRQIIKGDITRGVIVESEWTGTNTQNAVALHNQYYFSGVDVATTIEDGYYRLNAHDATQYNPIDNWELIGDAERKDLFQNPNWDAGVEELGGPLQSGELAAIRWFLENNYPPHGPNNMGGAFDPQSAGDGIPSYVNDISPLAGTVFERAYARYQAGNDEFENDAYGGGYVLKHTTNVPSRWGYNVADFGAGQLYSTAQLLTEIGDPSLWQFVCPARLQYKINLIGANPPALSLSGTASSASYAWTWKKSRSTEETAANNRVNILQHYTLELWNIDDYALRT